MKLLLLVALVTVVTVLHEAEGAHLRRKRQTPQPPARIRYGAFNVQVFGRSKLRKAYVTEVLVRILKRYDIVLIQEIRDSSKTAIFVLLNILNSRLTRQNRYKMVISQRLGRSNSKEQYAFFYKPSVVHVVGTYQYPDLGRARNDQYQREPFVVHFHSPFTEVSDFAILGVHTEPKNAEKEIDHLVDVYAAAKHQLGVEDFILSGDFNADCSYVTKKEWSKIRLWTDKSFKWLLGNEADTTVAKSSCAYDRIVLAGEKMKHGYVDDSVKIYDYKPDITAVMKLKPWVIPRGYNVAKIEKKVSDHYPVEIELKLKKVDLPPPVEHAIKIVERYLALPSTDRATKKQIIDRFCNVRKVKQILTLG